MILYAFDLLELHGEDWRPRPLEERKARLAKLLARAPAGIQYTEHLEGDGAAIFAHACRLGAEGIVSKHREHPYRSGPTKAWLKTKNPRRPACCGSGRSHERGADHLHSIRYCEYRAADAERPRRTGSVSSARPRTPETAPRRKRPGLRSDAEAAAGAVGEAPRCRPKACLMRHRDPTTPPAKPRVSYCRPPMTLAALKLAVRLAAWTMIPKSCRLFGQDHA